MSMLHKLSDSVFMAAVRALPRRALTRGAGRLARMTVPQALRSPLYKTYSGLTGADPDEAAAHLASYPSLDAFFTRTLREGARTRMVPDEDWAVPADGVISQQGRVRSDEALQVKGRPYSISRLLGESASSWEGARYATVYLSPADYHRVHWPTSGRVIKTRRLGAELWPVNGPSVRGVDELFVQNERLVTIVEDTQGRRGAVVMVAATVVGGIEARFDERESGVSFTAGEEHAVFHLGSTVVLVLDDSAAPTEHREREEGSDVRLGEALWTAAGS